MSQEVKEATTPEEIRKCWNPLFQLRPHLIEKQLVQRVTLQQKEDGYHLMYIEEDKIGAVAILGYRVQNYLWSGKTLYIDDFCTLVGVQKKGYGGKLMDWVIAKAKELKCDCVTLDSGYTRLDAHRFYLVKGFHLGSHHFHMNL